MNYIQSPYKTYLRNVDGWFLRLVFLIRTCESPLQTLLHLVPNPDEGVSAHEHHSLNSNLLDESH